MPLATAATLHTQIFQNFYRTVEKTVVTCRVKHL